MELTGVKMALPRQVQEQLDAAESIEKQLAENTPEVTPPVAEVVTNELTQVAEPTENTPEVTPPVAEPETPEAEVVEPVAEPAEPVEPEKPMDKWEQKYKTLKGMYDADVPRLHTQVRELTERLDAADEAQKARDEAEQSAANTTSLVTEDDVKEFGADLIEVQRKVAREVAAEFKQELDSLRSENKSLREQIDVTGAQVSEVSLEQRLTATIPDWESVNASEGWVSWLNEIDPLTQQPRRNFAQDAFNRADIKAVAHFVDMYRAETAPATEPTAPSPAEELSHQIQPSQSAAPSAAVTTGAKTYTDAQVRSMFQQTVELNNRGQHAEAQALEAEIDAAYLEGRVTA